MQDVLEFILKNITTVPGDVKVDVQDEEGTTNYLVTVNPADVGRIIGKEGKIIKAIRTIMRVIAIQKGVHIRVSVVSESESTPIDSTSADASAPIESVPQEDGSITVEV